MDKKLRNQIQKPLEQIVALRDKIDTLRMCHMPSMGHMPQWASQIDFDKITDGLNSGFKPGFDRISKLHLATIDRFSRIDTLDLAIPFFNTNFQRFDEEPVDQRKRSHQLNADLTTQELECYQMTKEDQIQLVEDPGPITPVDFEKLFHEKSYQIRIDSARHLLQLPDEPFCVIKDPERRTAVSEVPSYETNAVDSVVLQAVKSYSSPNSIVYKSLQAQYGGSYRDLPASEAIPTSLLPLLYEPEIERSEEVYNPSDKRGWLFQVTTLNQVKNQEKYSMKDMSKHLKRRWVVLRKIQEEETTTGYLLECFKDEREEQRGKNPRFSIFLADPIFEAAAFDDDTKDVKKKHGFELKMHNEESIKVNAVFVIDNGEQRDDWVTKINEALASSKQNEMDETSDPEDEVDDERLNRKRCENTLNRILAPFSQPVNSRFSAQNSTIFAYMKERHEDVARKRKKNRHRLLALSAKRAKIEKNISETINETEEQNDSTIKFILHALQIKYHLRGCVLHSSREGEPQTNLEPFFVTFALYDAKAKRKISSDFHAQLNHKAVKEMANPVGIQDKTNKMYGEPERKKINYSWIENPKQAIFEVHQPHDQIYLVAKVERVLQGGIQKSTAPYMKKDDSEKVVTSLLKSVRGACSRIPDHRMPFCWGAVPLFDQTGAIAPGGVAAGQSKQVVSFPELYRQEPGKLTDADIFRFLAEIGKPGKYLEKLETIFRHPSSHILSISIEQTKEHGLVDVLTSSLNPVKPYHASGADPFFEIDSFEQIAPTCAKPFSTYVNHLYVRPILLRYDAQKNFPKARNIAISCELWDGDELGKSRRLCCLYTRPETRGLIFDTSRHTAVTHHQTNPQFYEEIKIELPPSIHDGHHVKFVIYHVAVDPKKTSGLKGSLKGNPNSEAVLIEIGTSWIQLKNRDGRLVNESKDLPVFVTTVDKTLPDRYMSKVPPEGNWVDSGKKLLYVDIALHSTVHVTGKLLHSFLAHPTEARHITALPGEVPTELIQHLPLVINGLLSLIASEKTIPKPEYRAIQAGNGEAQMANNNVQTIELSKSDRYADLAFSTLVSIVSILSQQCQRHNLEKFIKNRLDLPDQPELHESMLAVIVALLDQELMTNDPKKHTQEQLLVQLNTFLSILEKLMFQYLHRTNKKLTKKSARFSLTFLTNLERLVQLTCHHMTQLKSAHVVERSVE